jgi:hypothetical protein
MITKLLVGLHSSQGRLTGGPVCQALLIDLGKLLCIFVLLLSSTLLHTGGVVGIARVSPCQTQQVQAENI